MRAAVMTQVVAMVLEEGELVTKRPSLGAGNDSDRVFDLETTHRVAEFKLSSWKGHDGGRQRGLFADVVVSPWTTPAGGGRFTWLARFLSRSSRPATVTP